MRKKGTRRHTPHLYQILLALDTKGEWSGHKKTELTHRSLAVNCDGILTILKVSLEEDQVLLECDMHANYIRLSLAEVKSKVG